MTSAHHAAASRVNDERVIRAVTTVVDSDGGWHGTGDAVFHVGDQPVKSPAKHPCMRRALHV